MFHKAKKAKAGAKIGFWVGGQGSFVTWKECRETRIFSHFVSWRPYCGQRRQAADMRGGGMALFFGRAAFLKMNQPQLKKRILVREAYS